VLAWITSAKFEGHLPTYRHQEMLVGPLGLWLSRPLLWKLLAGTARCLKPLALLLREEILKSYVVQADETPVRYLGEEQGKSSVGYLFGYAGDADHRFLFYDFEPNRSRAGPREMLADVELFRSSRLQHIAINRGGCDRGDLVRIDRS
jgi:hypothetical protein